MPSVVSARATSSSGRAVRSPDSLLPHWSSVTRERRARPAPTVAAVLHDLTSWGADIAVLLTRGCPEDRAAIERVRHYAHAWLAGESCPDVSIEDVLTTAAALMAGIDRNLGGTVAPEDTEHDAIGAAVA